MLEKPSTSNSEEAGALFSSSPNEKVAGGDGGGDDGGRGSGSGSKLVLLEAVHALFHPAFRRFLSLIDSPKVEEAQTSLSLPKGVVAADDIRFNFPLGGGATLDCGTYCLQLLRKIFGAEPVECVEARAKKPGFPDKEKIDEAMTARLRFPNGGTGSIDADLRRTGGYPFPWLTKNWSAIWTPVARAREKERIVEDKKVGQGKEHVVSKEVILWNFVAPSIWHRIDVVEEHAVRVRESGEVVKRWKEKEAIKEYGPKGKEWWTSYRWQLEAFVDRIKGRDGVGAWVEGEDSVGAMKAIDMVYEKAGLPLRPTTLYLK